MTISRRLGKNVAINRSISGHRTLETHLKLTAATMRQFLEK